MGKRLTNDLKEMAGRISRNEPHWTPTGKLYQNVYSVNPLRNSMTDETGYYTGYCQCNCPACRKGKRHCQGLVCKGD